MGEIDGVIPWAEECEGWPRNGGLRHCRKDGGAGLGAPASPPPGLLGRSRTQPAMLTRTSTPDAGRYRPGAQAYAAWRPKSKSQVPKPQPTGSAAALLAPLLLTTGSAASQPGKDVSTRQIDVRFGSPLRAGACCTAALLPPDPTFPLTRPKLRSRSNVLETT